MRRRLFFTPKPQVVIGAIAVIMSLTIVGTSIAPPVSHAISQDDLNGIIESTPFFDPNATTCSSSSGSSTTLTGSDYPQKAFNYFVGQGLTPNQSAGIVGNLYEESNGVNPNAVQAGGPGRGIAQWSVNQRWDGRDPLTHQYVADSVYGFAKGADVYDLALQLNFVWYELSGPYTNALKAVKATATLNDAVIAFQNDYEAPNPAQAATGLRESDAAMILQKYGNSAGGTNNSSGCSVQCTLGSGTINTNISPTRQKIVCLAEQELAIWNNLIKTEKPPYGNPPYFIKYTAGYECNDPPPNPPPGGSCDSNGTQEWCADFVSWIYKQAGDPFTGGANGGWRLDNINQIKLLPNSNPNFHWHPVDTYTPKPGDAAIHGYGHVNIVISVTANIINGHPLGYNVTTIGGDEGSGPYGGPESASIVQETIHGPFGNWDDTIGYTSPD